MWPWKASEGIATFLIQAVLMMLHSSHKLTDGGWGREWASEYVRSYVMTRGERAPQNRESINWVSHTRLRQKNGRGAQNWKLQWKRRNEGRWLILCIFMQLIFCQCKEFSIDWVIILRFEKVFCDRGVVHACVCCKRWHKTNSIVPNGDTKRMGSGKSKGSLHFYS